MSEKEHSTLPSVPEKEADHMRYRVKEECGLCGKTLLLRPHLRKAHNLTTWDEHIQKLKKVKGKKRIHITSAEETSESPAGGLNSLLKEITQVVASDKGKQRPKRWKPAPSANEEESGESPPGRPLNVKVPKRWKPTPSANEEESGESPPGSPLYVKVPYTEEEFLRFCVHNTNLYMVLATHQAMQSGKKDPVAVLNYLSKNKLNIEYCKFIVDMNYIPKIYGYYRFSRYYPYAKEKCISCTLKPCSCGKLSRSFYTFCRRACNQTHFKGTVCKNWGSGYHVCEDFFWCKVCDAAAKRCPIPIEHL